ncbi:MAG: hypothetical protein ACPIOQ_20015 [Promethearchaeia archaeon]
MSALVTIELIWTMKQTRWLGPGAKTWSSCTNVNGMTAIALNRHAVTSKAAPVVNFTIGHTMKIVRIGSFKS